MENIIGLFDAILLENIDDWKRKRVQKRFRIFLREKEKQQRKKEEEEKKHVFRNLLEVYKCLKNDSVYNFALEWGNQINEEV
jgi:hypothetical protein